MKALVAKALADRVQDGDLVGLGSGSTVEMALAEIGKRISSENIRVRGVATSFITAQIAAEAGIEVMSSFAGLTLDWAFDGADEVDPKFRMIKGRGAALLSEKIVARCARKLVIIVSEEKLVDTLGSVHLLPIEVIPEAASYVREELSKRGATEVVLRAAEKKCGPVITEHNNVLFDVRFPELYEGIEDELTTIVGVVETGSFFRI